MTSPTTRPPRLPKSPAAGLTAARKAAAALARAAAPPGPDPTITHPAESAELVAAALTPGATPDSAKKALAAAAKAAGMTDGFVRALTQRLERNPEFVASGVALTNEQFVAMLDDKIRLLLAHLDPVVMAQMSGKDLMRTAAIAYDKKRLALEQPTQIVDTTVRRSLDELWPALVAEAERRGLAIPSSRMVDVTPRLDGAQRRLESLTRE